MAISFPIRKIIIFTAAKYVRYALNGIPGLSQPPFPITKGVKYAQIRPSARITLDCRSFAKYADIRVKIPAEKRVAISGIVACAVSVAREPYIRVPYRRSIPPHIITSAK